MWIVTVFTSAFIATIASSSISGSDAVAAELVKLFKECGDKPVDLHHYTELLFDWRSNVEMAGYDPVTVSSDPQYDFITAIYENVPFTNEKFYEEVSGLDIDLKIHHLNTLCRLCDPSTPSFKDPTRLIESLYDYEKTNLLGKIINHCWASPLVLKYARIVVKKFRAGHLVNTIATESPEKLGALFHLDLQLSITDLKTILKCDKCTTLPVEIKNKIIFSLIKNYIFDEDPYAKINSILETAAKNWGDDKFGRALGDYTGYIPHSPKIVLLLLRRGFHLVCDRKKNYFHGLQAALETYKMLKLADDSSIPSMLHSELRILISRIIAFHATPVLRTLTVTCGYYTIEVQMQDIGTAGELLQLACRRFNMMPSANAVYCDNTRLGADTLIKDIPREGNLDFRTVHGADLSLR